MKSHQETIEGLLLKFEQRLTSSMLPAQVVERSPQMLRRRTADFRGASENRDGRGVKADVNASVIKTLRQLCQAAKHVRCHPDGSVRKAASRLLRLVQSNDFREIQAEASSFEGKLKRAGRRRNEEAKRQQAEDRRVAVDEYWTLLPVLSAKQLEAAGKRLSLCVANRRDYPDYFEQLREGSSEFHILEYEGKHFALIELDITDEKRVVTEIKASDNEIPELERSEALAILRKLNATADEEKCFSRVGAYSPFVWETPSKAGRFFHARDSYDVWWSPSQQLLTVKRDRTRHRSVWSLFRRELSAGTTLPTWEKVDYYRNGFRECELPSLLALIERECPRLGRRLCPTLPRRLPRRGRRPRKPAGT